MPVSCGMRIDADADLKVLSKTLLAEPEVGKKYGGTNMLFFHFLAPIFLPERPSDAVSCGMRIEPLTTEAFASLDYRVMSCAYASQNQIGRLADERIYEASLACQLEKIGLSGRRQVPIHVQHHTFHKTYFLDAVALPSKQ